MSDVCFITDHVAYASSNKTKNRLNRDGTLFFLFLPGVDASHVYMRAWALGCFYSHISTRTFRGPGGGGGGGGGSEGGADRVGGQLRGDKECPFSGAAKSGRVWRKVPESDARSVPLAFSGLPIQALCVSLAGRVYQ